MSRVGLILRDYGVYLVDSATMNVMNITPYHCICHTQEFWFMTSKSIPNKEVVALHVQLVLQ